MAEPLEIGGEIDGSLGRSRHKPELPVPKISYEEFMEAQQDDKVKRALREAQEEADALRQEGKIRA